MGNITHQLYMNKDKQCDKILIAHEAPISIMEYMKSKTDYDYALVHFFENKNTPDYYKYFKKSVEEGRIVILDNSLFELGESFNPESFIYWINELNPTIYVVPDVWNDYKGTIKSCKDWFIKYRSSLPKNNKPLSMAVVQGNNVNDLFTCYKELSNNPDVDIIAINHSDVYKEFTLSKTYSRFSNEYNIMLGRIKFVDQLINKGLINYNKPHHLLGCTIPSEFSIYSLNRPRYRFIRSLDTSNPVLASIDNLEYDLRFGLFNKPKTKITDVIDLDSKNINMKLLDKNLHIFKNNFIPYDLTPPPGYIC